jgi:hypothetical protein
LRDFKNHIFATNKNKELKKINKQKQNKTNKNKTNKFKNAPKNSMFTNVHLISKTAKMQKMHGNFKFILKKWKILNGVF